MQRCRSASRVARRVWATQFGSALDAASGSQPCVPAASRWLQALQEAAGACQEAQHAQQASRAFASRVHCMAAADFDDVAEVDESGEDSDDAEEAYGFSLGSLGPGARLRASTDVEGEVAPTHFETGHLARLTNGACLAVRGGTQVLATVACNRNTGLRATEGLMFQVDYREQLFASGRMPGGSSRMEGTTNEEVLAGRSVDAALRPLFPSYAIDMQVAVNVQSVDELHDPAVLAINAASAAVCTSPLEWRGPVGAVRVVVDADGTVAVDGPPPPDTAAPILSVLVAGTRQGITLLEAEGSGATEKHFLQALAAAEPAVEALIAAQERLAAEAQVAKVRFRDSSADPVAVAVVERLAQSDVYDALRVTEDGKAGRARRLYEVKAKLVAQLQSQGSWRHALNRVHGSSCVSQDDLDAAMAKMVSTAVRDLLKKKARRVDGRGLVDLRPLYCEVGTVPVVHGSSLFQRGETQVIAAATLADSDKRDVLGDNCASPLIVHYTSPPWANGQVTLRMGNWKQKRREVGHSELVRRALQQSIPRTGTDHPWTARINADTLSSNGSSSMAAVCAGSLALHAAGIPLSDLTAGVSIGLITTSDAAASSPRQVSVALGGSSPDSDESSSSGGSAGNGGGSDGGSGWFSGTGQAGVVPKTYHLPAGKELIVDIQGLEDAVGDMDFKIAGTRKGITAARLDVKAQGISAETVGAALRAAGEAHTQALATMTQAVQAAPPPEDRFGNLTIEQREIGRLIGPSGANIKLLQAKTGALLHVHDSGRVDIFAPRNNLAEAIAAVESSIGGNVKIGGTYKAKVVKIMDYGAFVELAGTGGTQALVHISEMAVERVRSVQDVVTEGGEVEVKAIGRDAVGNVRLSMKAVIIEKSGQAAGTAASGWTPAQRPRKTQSA